MRVLEILLEGMKILIIIKFLQVLKVLKVLIVLNVFHVLYVYIVLKILKIFNINQIITSSIIKILNILHLLLTGLQRHMRAARGVSRSVHQREIRQIQVIIEPQIVIFFFRVELTQIMSILLLYMLDVHKIKSCVHFDFLAFFKTFENFKKILFFINFFKNIEALFVREHDVLLQGADVEVGLAAVAYEADVLRPFYRGLVDVEVLLEVARGGEALSTLAAGVGLHSGVDPLVSDQVRDLNFLKLKIFNFWVVLDIIKNSVVFLKIIL